MAERLDDQVDGVPTGADVASVEFGLTLARVSCHVKTTTSIQGGVAGYAAPPATFLQNDNARTIMGWFKRRRQKIKAHAEENREFLRDMGLPIPPTDGEKYVDFDAGAIPLGDVGDPTSLLMTITMEHGASVLRENPDGSWTLNVIDKGSWTGATQMDVLTAARTALEGR